MIFKYLVRTSDKRLIGRYDYFKQLIVKNGEEVYLFDSNSLVLCENLEPGVVCIDIEKTKKVNPYWKVLDFWKYAGNTPREPLNSDYRGKIETDDISEEILFFRDEWGLDVTMSVPNTPNTDFWKFLGDNTNEFITISTTATKGVSISLFASGAPLELIAQDIAGQSIRIILSILKNDVSIWAKTSKGIIGKNKLNSYRFSYPDSKLTLTLTDTKIYSKKYISRPYSNISDNDLQGLNVLGDVVQTVGTVVEDSNTVWAVEDKTFTATNVDNSIKLPGDNFLEEASPGLADGSKKDNPNGVFEGEYPQWARSAYWGGIVSGCTISLREDSPRSVNPWVRVLLDSKLMFQQELILDGSNTTQDFVIHFQESIKFTGEETFGIEVITAPGEGKLFINEITPTHVAKIATKLTKNEDGSYTDVKTNLVFVLGAGQTIVKSLDVRSNREEWVEETDGSFTRLSKRNHLLVSMVKGAEELISTASLITNENLKTKHEGYHKVSTEVNVNSVTDKILPLGLVELETENETEFVFGPNLKVRREDATELSTSPITIKAGVQLKVIKELDNSIRIKNAFPVLTDTQAKDKTSTAEGVITGKLLHDVIANQDAGQTVFAIQTDAEPNDPANPTIVDPEWKNRVGSYAQAQSLVDGNKDVLGNQIYFEGDRNWQLTRINFSDATVSGVKVTYKIDTPRNKNITAKVYTDTSSDIKWQQTWEIAGDTDTSVREIVFDFNQAFEIGENDKGRFELFTPAGEGRIHILEKELLTGTLVARELTETEKDTYIDNSTGKATTLLDVETKVETLPVENEYQIWVQDGSKHKFKRVSKGVAPAYSMPAETPDEDDTPYLVSRRRLRQALPPAPTGTQSDILLGQIFYSTHKSINPGLLYQGETYNWTDNTKLKALFDNEGHEFISDNGDDTFTIVTHTDFIRAGVGSIGKHVDDTTAVNGLHVNTGNGGSIYSYDPATKGMRQGDHNWQNRENGGDAFVLGGDKETAPNHRNAYFGIYGDLAVAVVDANAIDVLDEDDLVSDRKDAVPTQRSVKAYIDNKVVEFSPEIYKQPNPNTQTFSLDYNKVQVLEDTFNADNDFDGEIYLPETIVDPTGNFALSTENIYFQVKSGSTTKWLLGDGNGIYLRKKGTTIDEDNIVLKPDILYTAYYDQDDFRWYYEELPTPNGGGGSSTTNVELLDEDDFASDDDTKAPTQQSVKAYVDSKQQEAEDLRVEILSYVGSTSNGDRVTWDGGWTTSTIKQSFEWVEFYYSAVKRSGTNHLDSFPVKRYPASSLYYDGSGRGILRLEHQQGITSWEIRNSSFDDRGFTLTTQVNDGQYILKVYGVKKQSVIAAIPATDATKGSLNKPRADEWLDTTQLSTKFTETIKYVDDNRIELLNEDNLGSNSEDKGVTQKSVKAYVDSKEGLRGNPVVNKAALIALPARDYEQRKLISTGKEYIFTKGATNGFAADVAKTGFWIEYKPVEVLDEDDFISDSETAVPSQQSVKAYVDGRVNTLESINEDDFASNSETKVPTQKSVKAYIASQVTGGESSVELLNEDGLVTESETKAASQKSVKTYVDNNTPGPILEVVGNRFNWNRTDSLPDWLLPLNGQNILNADVYYPELWAIRNVSTLIALVEESNKTITLQNYNVEGRFARAGEVPGVEQTDATAPNGLRVSVLAEDMSYDWSHGDDSSVAKGNSTYNSDRRYNNITSVSGDSETRPINVSEVWCIIAKPIMASGKQISFPPVLDEDDFTSNDELRAATQQSIKAYIESEIEKALGKNDNEEEVTRTFNETTDWIDGNDGYYHAKFDLSNIARNISMVQVYNKDGGQVTVDYNIDRNNNLITINANSVPDSRFGGRIDVLLEGTRTT